MTIELALDCNRKSFVADEITIVVRDSATGELVERKLSVTFRENQFGIWLEGKDEFGDSQAIVIFSNFGRSQLEELLAKNFYKEPFL